MKTAQDKTRPARWREALASWTEKCHETAEMLVDNGVDYFYESPKYFRLGVMAVCAANGHALRTVRGLGNAYAAKPAAVGAIGRGMHSIPWRGGYEPTSIILRHHSLPSDRIWSDKTMGFCFVDDTDVVGSAWLRLAALHIDVTANALRVDAEFDGVKEAEVWHWQIRDNGWVQVPLGELQTAHVVQWLLKDALPDSTHLEGSCVPDSWHWIGDAKTPLPSTWYESELFLLHESNGEHLHTITAPRMVPGRSLAFRSAEMETQENWFPKDQLRRWLEHPPKPKSKRPATSEAPWIQKTVGSPYGKCICQGGSGACASGRHLYNHETNEVVLATGSEPYVAMSYVWSENSWKVTRRAVSLLAECTHCRYFWIDQLCIDQQCNEHKQEQVPQMGEVYQQAQLVACMVPQVTARLPSEVKDPAMVMERARYHRKTLLFRHQMKKQPWPQRVWTWQEGLLGSSTVFVTANDIVEGWVADNVLGPKRLDPENPLAKPDLVTNISGLPAGTSAVSLNLAIRASHTSIKRRWTSCQARRQELEQWGIATDFSLTEALKATHDRKATEKLDEIYAVLGMVRGGRDLRAQYGISREEALENALKAGLLSADILAGMRDWNLQNAIALHREPGRSWMPKLHDFLSVGQELAFNSGRDKFMTWSSGGAKVSLPCLPLLHVHPEDYDDGYGDVHKFWVLRDEAGQQMAKVPALGSRPDIVSNLVKLAMIEGPGKASTVAVLLVQGVDGHCFQLAATVWLILTDAGESRLSEEEIVIV